MYEKYTEVVLHVESMRQSSKSVYMNEVEGPSEYHWSSGRRE